LWVLRQCPDVQVVGLLTTVNGVADRVSMHAVRGDVLAAQARACGLTLHKVPLPDPCSDEDYRAAMAELITEARGQDVEVMAFGDLFLSDVRSYRERQLEGSGLTASFPLWGRSTPELAREMIDAGLRAVITCVDTEQLDTRFIGRAYDLALLEDLPPGVDPCGENGEFHTAVIAGPMFREPLRVEPGKIVERDRFVFADLVPL
jgi:uncharacterized protein (TIGR00290 family)